MPAKQKQSPKRPMADAHKAALAEGREQSRVVKTYLEALVANKPRLGRKRSPDTIRKQLQHVEQTLTGADPLMRVQLSQQRIDLLDQLDSLEQIPDLAPLEAAFVEVAAAYSERKGLTRAAWRE